MKIFEFLRGKREQEKAEETVEKKIEEYQKEETGKSAERQAAVDVMGAEKATAEQIENLRKVIGKEEETARERAAQVGVTGPEKATPEQEEALKPVREEEDEEQFRKAA